MRQGVFPVWERVIRYAGNTMWEQKERRKLGNGVSANAELWQEMKGPGIGQGRSRRQEQLCPVWEKPLAASDLWAYPCGFFAVWCGQISQSSCLCVTSAVSGGAYVRFCVMTCSQGCERSRSSINALPSTHFLCSYSPAPLLVNVISVAAYEILGIRFSPIKCNFITKEAQHPPSLEIPPCNQYLTAEFRLK